MAEWCAVQMAVNRLTKLSVILIYHQQGCTVHIRSCISDKGQLDTCAWICKNMQTEHLWEQHFWLLQFPILILTVKISHFSSFLKCIWDNTALNIKLIQSKKEAVSFRDVYLAFDRIHLWMISTETTHSVTLHVRQLWNEEAGWLWRPNSPFHICRLVGWFVEMCFLINEPAVATPQDEVKKSKNHRGV